MAGDYTRRTFDPTKAYSGVHKQQGRVSLDADFNEFEAILDRRRRVETIDTIGRCTVPMQTPDGFEIAVAAGQLTIGPGRAYVDGILIECRGAQPPAPPPAPLPAPALPAGQAYDVSIGEDRGLNPLPYLQQPFVYAQPNAVVAFPGLSAAGITDIVYVDVWQREVTALEDTGLLESALGGPGGPDTTTRVQSAWQVKVLNNVVAARCEDNPQQWLDLIAPSTARLTATATPGPVAAQPCVIDPAGGYTGLENRLYRIEVHQAGLLDPAAPGAPANAQQATFKWSRDNASLAVRVVAITAGPVAGQSFIEVVRTGRDRFLRFEANDYIELLDDDVEFAMRESGAGGAIPRIISVDYTNNQLLINQDLTAFTVVAARHPRVRRWDVDPLAVPAQAVVRNATPGVAIPIEAGIAITFSADPLATLHAGDYWVVAARTAIGDLLDPPVNAPPHGVLHHFCKLAVIVAGAAPEDCRDFWPPASGCCTEVVSPGESIQAAIDRLPIAGGCVCLKPGVHTHPATIRIARPDVTLHGETQGAIVRITNDSTSLLIGTAQGPPADRVMVHDLQIEVPGGGAIAIEVDGARDVTIERCHLAVAGPPVILVDAIGMLVERSERVLLRDSVIDNMWLGVWANRDSREVRVIGNRLTAFIYREQPPPPASSTEFPLGLVGIWLEEVFGACVVAHNAIRNYWVGVRVDEDSAGTLVARNTIRRPTSADVRPVDEIAFFSVPLPIPGQPDLPRFYAIEVRAINCLVEDNELPLYHVTHGGIWAGALRCGVHGNRIASLLPGAAPPSPLGIVIGHREHRVAATQCIVENNTLVGFLEGIVVIGRMGGHDIRDNHLEGLALGRLIRIRGIVLADAIECTAGGNQITSFTFGVQVEGGRAHRVEDNRIVRCGIGIDAREQRELGLLRNTIEQSEVGINADNVSASFIHDNDLRRFVAAIALSRPEGVTVKGNTLRNGIGGIQSTDGGAVTLTGNTIEDLTDVGIVVVRTGDVRMADNRLFRCGYEGDGFGFGAGIATVEVSPLTIESCEIAGTGRGPTGAVATRPTYGITVTEARVCVIRDNRIEGPAGLDAADIHRALRVLGHGSVDVTGNVLYASGPRRVVELRSTGVIIIFPLRTDVIFSNNRCLHDNAVPTPPAGGGAPIAPEPTVLIRRARRLTVMGNQVVGPGANLASFDFNLSLNLVAAGNISSGFVTNLPVNRRPANYATMNMVNT